MQRIVGREVGVDERAMVGTGDVDRGGMRRRVSASSESRPRARTLRTTSRGALTPTIRSRLSRAKRKMSR
jgi:hypothetical protein